MMKFARKLCSLLLAIMMVMTACPVTAAAATPEVQQTTYTVTYHANGGSGAPSAQTKTKDVSLILSTTRPTCEGYTFIGWSTSYITTTAQYQPGDSYEGNADITLYAIWRSNPFTVTYDAGGGENAPEQQCSADGSDIIVTDKVPTRVNGKFLYWHQVSPYDDNYRAGDTIRGGGDHKLEAVWALDESLHVKIWANSGQFAPPGQTIRTPVLITKLTNPIIDIEKSLGNFHINYIDSDGKLLKETVFLETADGHFQKSDVFEETDEGIIIGWVEHVIPRDAEIVSEYRIDFAFWKLWVYDQFGKLEVITNGKNAATGGITQSNLDPLYAIYANTDFTYRITYEGLTRQLKTHGKDLKLREDIPTKDGYIFQGWTTEQYSKNVQYMPGDMFSIDANTRLYPVWKTRPEGVSVVTYNANNGSQTPPQQFKIKGEKLTLTSEIPVREGYRFVGWATGRQATDAQFFPGDIYTKDEDITLYALWEAAPVTYTVTYNANGGENPPKDQTKLKDIILTISKESPTRAGYNFLGWATSSSAASAQYQPGSTYTANANITLYAVWEELNTIAINAANFPDANFRAVVSTFDKNGDGKLNESEITAVTEIDCSGKNISSLKGIECFTALTSLQCYGNQLTALDVSRNTALTELCCESNQLTTLDVSKNTALKNLRCSTNQLTTLDVSKNTALTELSCANNQLTVLIGSKNTALSFLCCSDNQLATLDVGNYSALRTLWCQRNQFTALDVSENTLLEELECGDNRLTALDVSKNMELIELECRTNQLTTLDVSKNTALTYLHCESNQLTTLDVSRNTALTTLSCWGNQLTALDVSKNTALKEWSCEKNTYDITLNANRSYDLSKLPGSFDVSKAKSWNGCTIQGSVIKVNAGVNEVSYTYDCGNGKTMPVTLNVVGVEVPPATYTVTFHNGGGTGAPDTQTCDAEGKVTIPLTTPERKNREFMYWAHPHYGHFVRPGEVLNLASSCELTPVWALEWRTDYGAFVGLGSATGMPGDTVEIPVFIRSNEEGTTFVGLEGAYSGFEYGTGLNGPVPEFLEVAYADRPIWDESLHATVIGTVKYKIPENIDPNGDYYAHLGNIKRLWINDIYNDGGSTEVIIDDKYAAGGKEALASNGRIYINCESKPTVDINAANFPDTNFRAVVSTFDKNGDGKLNEAEIAAVTEIDCSGKNISSLNGIEYFTALTALWCYDNQLTVLDVSGNPRLELLSCYGNQLTALDLSSNTVLVKLWCFNNKLTTLNISSNSKLELLSCYDNQISELDVSSSTELMWLYCYRNRLTSLDVSNNAKLKSLNCYGNQLASLDLNNNLALANLMCDGNSHPVNLDENRSLDLTTLPGQFDVSKVLEWMSGCTVDGTRITFHEGCSTVNYRYNCGNGKTMEAALTTDDPADKTIGYIDYSENTYKGNICSNMPNCQKGNIDSSITLSEMSPTRPKGKFMYWVDIHTNTRYQPGETVTLKGDMELVAIWALDWDTSKFYLTLKEGCYGEPGSIVEVPIILNDKTTGIKKVHLDAEFARAEVTNASGININACYPEVCDYSYRQEEFMEVEEGLQIGTVRVPIPADAKLGTGFVIYPTEIGKLIVEDDDGPLCVYLDSKNSVDGQGFKTSAYGLYASSVPMFIISYITDLETNAGLPIQYKTQGVPCNLTDEIPTREGYTFRGWSTNREAVTVDYQPGARYTADERLRLYAVWEQQEVTGCCLEVGKTVATHGKEVLVPISISQNPGFAGINVKIDYDKTRLQFIGSGDIAGLDWTVNTGDNAGAVMVSIRNYTKDGEILLLKFKVPEDAPDGFAKVSLFNAYVLTIDEKPISVTVSSGGVEVITRLPGDVTGDGVLDTRDALRLKKHLAGLDAPIVWQNADVTGDNDVTLADLLRLMKYLAGMQVELV
mgnify:CR=1 FL=1